MYKTESSFVVFLFCVCYIGGDKRSYEKKYDSTEVVTAGRQTESHGIHLRLCPWKWIFQNKYESLHFPGSNRKWSF